MKKIILALAIISWVNFLTAQHVYKQKLSDLAIIDFPQKPDFRDTLNQKIFSYNGDSAIYLVVVVDVSSDHSFKVKPGSVNEVYNGAIKGTLETTNGTQIIRKNFKIDALEGAELYPAESGLRKGMS